MTQYILFVVTSSGGLLDCCPLLENPNVSTAAAAVEIYGFSRRGPQLNNPEDVIDIDFGHESFNVIIYCL